MNKQVTKKIVATFTSVATVAMMTVGAFLPMAAGAAVPTAPTYLFSFSPGFSEIWDSVVQGDMLWVVGGGYYGGANISLFKLQDTCPAGTTAVVGAPGICGVDAVQGLSLSTMGLRVLHVAADASGNAYVEIIQSFSNNGGRVIKVTPTGAISSFATGFYQPYNYHGIAVYNGILYKATGKVYPAFGTVIKKYNLDGTSAGADIDLTPNWPSPTGTYTGPTDLSVNAGIMCVSGTNVPTRGPWCFDLNGMMTSPVISELGGHSGQTVDIDSGGRVWAVPSSYQYDQHLVVVLNSLQNNWLWPGETNQYSYFFYTNPQQLAPWSISFSDPQARVFLGSFTGGSVAVYSNPLLVPPISPCASNALTSAGLTPTSLTAAQLAQLEAQCTSDPSQVIVVPADGAIKGGIKPNPSGTCFVIVGEGANVSGGIHCKKAGFCDVLMASNSSVNGGIKDMKDVYINGTGVSVSGGIHNAASFILGENAEIAVSGGIKGITQFFKVLANSFLTASGGITCAGAAVTQDPTAVLTVSGAVACGPLVALALPSEGGVGDLLALAAAALAAGLGIGVYARRKA